MDLLRFTTAGNVDDGKSTLIGRLLHDSKALFDDQMEAIEAASRKRGDEYVNLALVTDGLRAEREQGITIDVAYRYFATTRRKFIIADTPGHVQYTRNMVTGASTSSLAIILVDARKGLVEQTFRHCLLASLLRLRHLVVCVNKMDLVGYDERVFASIRDAFAPFGKQLAIRDVTFIPISALAGDNVVERSANMPWYEGPALLEHLETVEISHDRNETDFRFPVQLVIRPASKELHDYRGCAGYVASGSVKVGDEVVALPSGLRTKVVGVELGAKEVGEARAPMSVTLRLADELDVGRGDMLVKADNLPAQTQELEAMVCWMDHKPLSTQGRYVLLHTTQAARCSVREVQYKLDVQTLEGHATDRTVGLNDVARVTLRSAKPLFVDSYSKNRQTGSLVLVDEVTNLTVGACMVI